MGSARRPNLRVDIQWAGNEIRLGAPKSTATEDAEPNREHSHRSLPSESEPETLGDDWFAPPMIANLHRCMAELTEWVRGLEKCSVEWLQGLESEMSILQKEIKRLSTELEVVRELGESTDVGANRRMDAVAPKVSNNGGSNGKLPNLTSAEMGEVTPDTHVEG
jgi:hypothetical protein